MAAAVLFGAASCAKEDISSSIANGETVEVTFTANLTNIGTRAYGDAEEITTLRYFVFDAETNIPISGLSGSTTEIIEVEGKKTFTVKLSLIKGVSYNMLFWADNYDENADSNHYDINTEERVVTVNYENAVANDETRDAFFAVRKGFTASNVDTNVTLRRPFAQLNVYANDIEAAHTAGIETIYSSFTTDVYTTLNPFAGEDESDIALDDKERVTFKQTLCPDSETGHLSMNYLLVPSNKTTINVSYEFKGKYEGNDTEVTLATPSFTYIPIQRNYKTNIKGSLLTDNTNFNVTIEKDWEEVDVNKVFSASDLQSALDIAVDGDIIYLGANIVGDVTAIQKQGVKVTIDGCNYSYNGTIKVHSKSNHYADAALTIKNVNFATATPSINCIEALENGAERYSSNITVENCSFTATGEAVGTSVGVQIKSSKNAKVLNCTATDMHSLIQAQSCDETVVVNGCTVNGKNGVAFKQVKAATVEGTTITAAEYGIRFDGNTDNYGIAVKNNNVTANQPLIVRKMTGQNNTIALEGTNTLTVPTASASTEAIVYHIVITNGSDDEAYVKPTGTYTLTGADNYVVYPRDYYYPVATWDELIAAIEEKGEPKVMLTQNITISESKTITKSVVINLNGNAFEIDNATACLYIGDKNNTTKPNVTIKEGNLNGMVYGLSGNVTITDVVFGGTISYIYAYQGVISTKHASLLMDNCKMTNVKKSGSTKPRSICTEGRSSGYLILRNCNFKNSNLDRPYINPLNGNTTFELTNCALYGGASNIDLGASYLWTNMNLTGCSGGFTFTISRASTSLTDEEMAVYKAIKKNNTGSMRFIFSDGEKNNL